MAWRVNTISPGRKYDLPLLIYGHDTACPRHRGRVHHINPGPILSRSRSVDVSKDAPSVCISDCFTECQSFSPTVLFHPFGPHSFVGCWLVNTVLTAVRA